MRLLIITNLFPNRVEPDRAVFNKQQFLALKKYCDFKVVAPVPLFQYAPSELPLEEDVNNIRVFHPRYLVIPKICRSLYGWFYYWGIARMVRRIHALFPFDAILATWAYPDAFAAALLAKRLRKPLVIKVHGTDINVATQYFLRRQMIVSKSRP